MTNERLQKIRETHGCLIPVKTGVYSHERSSCDCTVTELLAVVDRLTAESVALRIDRDETRDKLTIMELLAHYQALEKENIALKSLLKECQEHLAYDNPADSLFYRIKQALGDKTLGIKE